MQRLIWLLGITLLLTMMLCGCTNDSQTSSLEEESSISTDDSSTLEATVGMTDAGAYDDGHTWNPVS